MIERGSRRVVVTSDEAGRAHGRALHEVLAAAGYRVSAVERAQYPIGDGLPALLGALAYRSDACLAVVSSSERARSWLLRQLAIETLYPSWLLAIAPDARGWQSRVDETSFRVLLASEGVVPRLDEWFAPAARPPSDPPLGRWLPFDPAWLVRTVAGRLPLRDDVARSLADCTLTVWDAPWYQSFRGPNAPSTQEPTVETLVVRDRLVGLVSIHLGPGGRVDGIGYLATVPQGGCPPQ